MDVSFLIPARHEQFLKQTVEDIVSHFEADSEVIVVCDGEWADPPLTDSPHVHILYHPAPIGQRAATNEAAKVAKGRYVCKIDAHCAVDQGFDRKMMTAGNALGRDVTQIPAMYNLHVFDWKCPHCGHRSYQGPTPTRCEHCKQTSNQFERVMVWNATRQHKRTEFWRFDHDLHFQYWGDFRRRPESQGDIVDVMTSIGACFFMRRDRFLEIGGLDVEGGIWGQFGVEIACKSWLSGGRHVVNKTTWFSHMFRTQGADFGFPYPLGGRAVDRAREYSRNLWLRNTWPHQTRPLSWLIDKFMPIPGWSESIGAARLAEVRAAGAAFLKRQPAPSSVISAPEPADVAPVGSQSAEAPAPPPARPTLARPGSKGLVYYSDCRGDATILEAVRARLRAIAGAHNYRLVAVTLDPVDLGFNRVLPLERGYLTMFKQILTGLELLDTEYAYLVEHDILYHPSHFEFTPDRHDTFYYNQNVWKVDAETGKALFYYVNQTSGLCGDRQLLIDHYRERVARVEREGYQRTMGFEPGTRKIRHGGIDDRPYAEWMAPFPNIDIRHGSNLTPSRWSKDQFRNQRYTKGWTEADEVPGWGVTRGRFQEVLSAATQETMLV